MLRRISKRIEISGFINPVRYYSIGKDEAEKTPTPITPAIVVARGLADLQPLTFKQKIVDYEGIGFVSGAYTEVKKKKENREIEVKKISTPFIELLKILQDKTWPPRGAEILGGLGVITFVNIIQIWATALLEFGFRTAGTPLLRPMSWLHEADANKKKRNFAIRIVGSAVCLPFWCVGKTLDLVGDVLSYTRMLLDSTSRLVPLGWFVRPCHSFILKKNQDNKKRDKNNKPFLDVTEPLPSIGGLVKNFFTATIQLLPATFIILTGLFTGGVSIPILQGLAAPLSAIGNAILAPLASSSLITAIAGGFGLAGAAGAVATVSKGFSGIVGGISDHITIEQHRIPKKEAEQIARTGGSIDEDAPKGIRRPDQNSNMVYSKKLGIKNAATAKAPSSALPEPAVPPVGSLQDLLIKYQKSTGEYTPDEVNELMNQFNAIISSQETDWSKPENSSAIKSQIEALFQTMKDSLKKQGYSKETGAALKQKYSR